MKRAIVTFLVIASSVTTVAVAQDGSAQGPPKKSVVFVSAPTTTSPTTTAVPTTSQPKLR